MKARYDMRPDAEILKDAAESVYGIRVAVTSENESDAERLGFEIDGSSDESTAHQMQTWEQDATNSILHNYADNCSIDYDTANNQLFHAVADIEIENNRAC